MVFSLSSIIGTFGGSNNNKTGSSIYSYYAPLWFYDFCILLFWPLNYLISLYASFPLPSRPDYDLNPLFKEGSINMKKINESELKEIKGKLIQRSRQRFDEEQLLQLFDTLEPVSSSTLMKNFKGHVIHTGSILDIADILILKLLSFFGIRWGKRYRSPYIGDPLLLHIKYPFGFGGITIPIPIWGNVSLLNIEYRNKIQGTMNYDAQPWRDYFRLLQSTPDGKRIILGIWCCREKIGGWFLLEDYPELNNAVNDIHQVGTEKNYQH